MRVRLLMSRRAGQRPARPVSAPRPAPTGRARPGLSFLVRFGLLLGGFYTLLLFPWGDRALAAYLRANAWLAHGLLQALGQQTRLDGVTIRAANYALSIRRGCDAVEPAWFFCAAVLAFPAPWRTKPAALLTGSALILALNVVRIVSLFFIGRMLPGFFAMAHLELWPAAFLLLAVALWLVWIRRSSPVRPPPPHATL